MNRMPNDENESQLWCADLPFYALQTIPDTQRKAIAAEVRRLRFRGWCLVLFLPLLCVTLLVAGYFSPAVAYANAFFLTLAAFTCLLFTPYMIWGTDTPLRRSRVLQADLRRGAFREFRGPLRRMPCHYLSWPITPCYAFGRDGSPLLDDAADPLRRHFEIGENCQNSVLVGTHSNRIYSINDDTLTNWYEAYVTTRRRRSVPPQSAASENA